MIDHAAIDAEVRARIAEVQARVDSVSEGHRRWNRVEEAMDVVCEDAINLLDVLGRYDQATEISSHMAAHERFDLLLDVYRNDAAVLDEVKAAGLEQQHARNKALLEALLPIGKAEEKNRHAR